jgi:LacI family transcriptional regulator
MMDVAQLAGVSKAAVSKVLRNAYGVSPAMRARVESSMDTLQYRPLASARGMRGKSYTLGAVVSDVQNPFFALLVEGIVEHIGATDYELLLGPSGLETASQSRMVRAMLDRRMEGLILIAPAMSDRALGDIASRVPTVVIGRHGPAKLYDTVAGDDYLGSRLIVEHLVELGHEDISFILPSIPSGANRRRPEVARLAGYRNAMTEFGLSDHIDIVRTSWSHEGGREAGEVFRARSRRPTAVHAGADVAAFGLLSDLRGAGIAVPGEIAVVGYDNTPMSALDPLLLTTVDQFGHRMGREAARLLLGRLEGRTTSEHVLTTPELIIRSTTNGFVPVPR